MVVTIVDGGDVLRRFLQAMLAQDDAPAMQILLPFDASIPGTQAFGAEFPTVELIAMGPVETVRSIETAAGQHELYDKRRAAGLAQARGRLVSILEDRAPPRLDWAKNVMRLHAELPHGAIGGAIECAPGDLLNWSFYVCDFGRYALPFESGPRQWISDVNVSYKRPAIDATRDLWKERFNEARIHWALLERGETLFLSKDLVVDYRTPYQSLAGVLPERFHWGRLFGHVRGATASLPRRLAYALAAPLIVLRLFARHGATMAGKGQLGRYVLATPITLALLAGWITGEVTGYVTRKP